MALGRTRRDKNLRPTMSGATLVEVLIAIAILSLLLSSAISSIIDFTEKKKEDVCKIQLNLIQKAKVEYYLDHSALDEEKDEIKMNQLRPYLKPLPACPRGGRYRPGVLNENPICTCGQELNSIDKNNGENDPNEKDNSIYNIWNIVLFVTTLVLIIGCILWIFFDIGPEIISKKIWKFLKEIF